MIVFVIHHFCVTSYKTESDAPVGLYGDRPCTLAIALEFVETQRWDTQVIYRSCLLQLSQNQADSSGMVWLNACFVAGEEELFQPLVRKAPDHESIVTQHYPGRNLMGYVSRAPTTDWAGVRGSPICPTGLLLNRVTISTSARWQRYGGRNYKLIAHQHIGFWSARHPR